MFGGPAQQSVGQGAGVIEAARTAQRRRAHHVTLDPVPYGWVLSGQPDGAVCVRHSARPVAAGHRQFGAHPRQSNGQPGRRVRGQCGFGPGEQGCRRRQPAHPEGIGGQARQRIDARGRVVARQCQRPAVPAARKPMPAELTQQ